MQTQIDLTYQVKGILPIENGGTGTDVQTQLPDPTGHAGQVLYTPDGINVEWLPLDAGSF